LILPRAEARSLGGTSSKVVNDKLNSSSWELGSERRKKSCSFCGEDSGEVALGDKEREVKEATQALSTSGQTFSREQLDKSNQVREGEVVMGSKWQFSNSNWLNCAFETLENLWV